MSVSSSNPKVQGIPPTLNHSLPEVEPCTTAPCKAVFGVILDVENSGDRRQCSGTFVSLLRKEDGVDKAFVNSMGEGALWFCNGAGNLNTGDYLTTSEQAGYGTKQSAGILRNYTVARDKQDVDFSNLPSQVTSRTVGGYTCAFVGCTYHCG